jgi:hypothetical protein
MRHLLAWLTILFLAFAGRQLAGLLPHEPRLIVVNEDSGEPIEGLVITSDCGPIRVPRVGPGDSGTVSLPARPGCRYSLAGLKEPIDGLYGPDEVALDRYLEMARSRKADVILKIYFDGATISLSNED